MTITQISMMKDIKATAGNIFYSLKKLLPDSIINLLKDSHLYARLREIRRRSRKSLSQGGQDYWVINEAFDRKKKGYFVEIGSAEGVIINNTYLLEKCYEWSGICIEANPVFFDSLKQNRSCICLNLCVDAQEGEVNFVCNDFLGGILDQGTDSGKITDISKLEIRKLPTIPLVKILEQYKAPTTIDYLSIDVEGAETRILKNFPFDRYVFNSITIERPSQVLQDLLLANEYILVKKIPGLDSFYIHKSFREIYVNNQSNFYRSLRAMY